MSSCQIDVSSEKTRMWLSTASETVKKAAKYAISDIGKKATSAIKKAEATSYSISTRKISLKNELCRDGLTAIISSNRRGMSLYNFHARQDEGGVSFKTRKAGYIQHAFILRGVGSNGFDGVFIRSGNGARLKSNGAYNLKPLYGPNPGLLLKSEWLYNVAGAVARTIDDVFGKKLKALLK